MAYRVNLPYSVTLQPSTPEPMGKLKRISLGYIMDSPGFRVTTGDPGLDNLIKYGFWFGAAAILYKAYSMLRHDEPLFSAGTPAAWERNSYSDVERSAYPELTDEEYRRAFTRYESKKSKLLRGITERHYFPWKKIWNLKLECFGEPTGYKDDFIKAMIKEPHWKIADAAQYFGASLGQAKEWLIQEGMPKRIYGRPPRRRRHPRNNPTEDKRYIVVIYGYGYYEGIKDSSFDSLEKARERQSYLISQYPKGKTVDICDSEDPSSFNRFCSFAMQQSYRPVEELKEIVLKSVDDDKRAWIGPAGKERDAARNLRIPEAVVRK